MSNCTLCSAMRGNIWTMRFDPCLDLSEVGLLTGDPMVILCCCRARSRKRESSPARLVVGELSQSHSLDMCMPLTTSYRLVSLYRQGWNNIALGVSLGSRDFLLTRLRYCQVQRRHSV